MINTVMLSVVRLNVFMLSVVAPQNKLKPFKSILIFAEMAIVSVRHFRLWRNKLERLTLISYFSLEAALLG